MNKRDLADLRKVYSLTQLDERNMLSSPLAQFAAWFDEAMAADLPEPAAMVLSTVSPEGRPTSRVVLLKGMDTGFLFYTNYESTKGQNLSSNPRAALVFFWPELERQIRIEGIAHRLTIEESTAYFNSRPRESRIGAWTSQQSTVIDSREELDQRYAKYVTAYATGDIPKPPTWGGFRLNPDMVEFWQGRPSRLHDRIRYRMEHGAWIMERLSP